MPRRRGPVCSSRSQSELAKKYFSPQFARRCVFTQPRPLADIPTRPTDVCFRGVDRTCRSSGPTSAFDPIRTSCADPLTLSLRGTEAWLAGRGPSSETSARGDRLTKRSLGCACRAFQSHQSSTPTGCRCRILIREHIAVDRDETLLIRIVPRGKAAADNM
jgi:hypothetical protein